MALLLAMYQKMRLIREKNQATLDLTKFSSKYNRVSKNIERVQKRYTSLFANLDAQAKQMQSQAKIMFQNMAGLGASQVNPYDYSGITQYIMNNSYAMCQQGTKYKNGEEEVEVGGLSQSNYQALLQEYRANGKILPEMKDKEDGTGKEPVYVDGDQNGALSYAQLGDGTITADQVKMFMMSLDNAKQMQSQAQWQVQNMTTNYENNVSVWLEAAKAQLEAEQDAALEPLNYQQTMWELEKEQAEEKLTRIKAELESYTQLCNEEAKEQAPKFGLG